MSATTKERILRRLAEAGTRLAVHEFGLEGVSENALAARLRELTQSGITARGFREGEHFKEWWLNMSLEQALRALGVTPMATDGPWSPFCDSAAETGQIRMFP